MIPDPMSILAGVGLGLTVVAGICVPCVLWGVFVRFIFG